MGQSRCCICVGTSQPAALRNLLLHFLLVSLQVRKLVIVLKYLLVMIVTMPIITGASMTKTVAVITSAVRTKTVTECAHHQDQVRFYPYHILAAPWEKMALNMSGQPWPRSDCVSAQSDQGLPCPLTGSLYATKCMNGEQEPG